MTEQAGECFEFYESVPIRETDLPPRLAALRQKLSQKAKQEKRYRFYSLYNGVCDSEILCAAWKQVKANKGAAGVDGVSIEDVEQGAGGEAVFLAQLEGSLRDKTYRPEAVRRLHIPKANGKRRSLGIPTVRDRVVQTAVLLILEPIFEADFEDGSFGFRPGRSAHDALKVIQEQLKTGKHAVDDADLKGFDSIPHDRLIACVRMRVVDGSVLKLVRMWLQCPVVGASEGGKPPTVTRNKTGTPQGGVISPLLANIYLHWFNANCPTLLTLLEGGGDGYCGFAEEELLVLDHLREAAAEWAAEFPPSSKARLG